MGAMARQVLQVKRKNSTSCNCPAAKLTVEGSVASRLGPRDVATAGTAGARGSVGSATGGVDVSTPIGGAVATGEVAGAQAARKRASSTRLGRRRGFIIICISREFVPENPYASMNR